MPVEFLQWQFKRQNEKKIPPYIPRCPVWKWHCSSFRNGGLKSAFKTSPQTWTLRVSWRRRCSWHETRHREACIMKAVLLKTNVEGIEKRHFFRENIYVLGYFWFLVLQTLKLNEGPPFFFFFFSSHLWLFALARKSWIKG